MSGHSKWSTIKHKKGVADAKRAKAFTEVGKLIRVAVQKGQSDDPNFNPSLRLALEKARAVNMPKDNIQRAIDRGMGKGAAGRLEEVVYEGFGPGGVAAMVVSLTDNKQRTAAEVRNTFGKHGGSLAGPGSAAYMFERDEETGGYVCTMQMPLPDQASVEQLVALQDALLENDDVEDVYWAVTLPESWDVAKNLS